MLLVITVVAAVAAGALAVRWLLTRADSLGRLRCFPLASVGLCLTVAVGAGVPVVRHARFEDRLSTVASTLAGADVSVSCQTLSEAWTEARPEAGYVRFGPDGRPEPLATISLQTCDDLKSWLAAPDAAAPLAEIIAVHVLTHEAMHLRGLTDEARTECAAVQRDARTAVLLGASPSRAQDLAVTYWQQVYDRLPDSYRSADCRPGAAFDEHLDDPPWVTDAR